MSETHPTNPLVPQTQASDPHISAWVTANAGSGKTKVLIDRVARLLLGTGGKAPDPSRILCLTYTRAAAANMQNKLFEQLGGWALMEENALRGALEALQEPGTKLDSGIDLNNARRLFAQALETPGGLKIQTIHAFCESLLRRFPLEAGVSPHFNLMDEQEAQAILAEALDRVFVKARERTEPELTTATDYVIRRAQESGIHALVAEIVAKRDAFRGDAADTIDAVYAVLEVEAGQTQTSAVESFFSKTDADDIRAMALNFAKGGSHETKSAAILLPAMQSASKAQWLDALNFALLTKGNPRSTSRFPTKAVKAIDPDIVDTVERFQARLVELNARLRTIKSAEDSRNLVPFAKAIIDEVDTLKHLRDALDFGDLIRLAGDLLQNSEASAWVRYKLDGGVDHILVDEAQDTSPEQWRVVSAIAEEFFAGDGANPENRTLFVVGDEKQSIFSFQGAAPDALDKVRTRFRALLADPQDPLREPQLRHSFRSAPAVLAVVDEVFKNPAALDGLNATGDAPTHIAFRDHAPGRVEFWPPISVIEEDDPPDWWEPVNKLPADAPQLRLARGIVDQIETWLDLDTPQELPAKGRPIRAGDILILVRRRNDFAEAVISMLKARGLPVAGKDRMQLNTQLAVKDLLALARFALLPEDDLTLATVLRSPIIGISETALYDLTQGRSGRLWGTLIARREERDDFSKAHALLSQMLKAADFLRPYEFFERVLTQHGARGRLLDRLGVEAADPIDELLSQALEFENDGPPSLQTFVNSIENADTQIKREMEQGRDEIRIMTVHGSKGLEAPIVFLPDICALPTEKNFARIFPVTEQAPVWAPISGDSPDVVQAMRTDADAKRLEEYRRLLYVGMTRAEDWLIVCGWHGKNQPKDTSWAKLVESAFAGAPETGMTPLLDSNDEVIPSQVFESKGEPDKKKSTAVDEPLLLPLPVPAQLLERPRSETSAPQPIAPSRVGGGQSDPFDPMPLAGEYEDSDPPLSSAERGTLLHLLLEHLAPLQSEAREDAAAAMGATDLLAPVLRILNNSAYAWMFGPDSMAEVPIHGPVSALNGRAIVGTIDRLVFTNSDAHIIDFKSGRAPANGLIPASYLRQLSIYRAALTDIFEQRDVHCHLLWIDENRLDTPTSRQLDAALQSMLNDGSLDEKRFTPVDLEEVDT